MHAISGYVDGNTIVTHDNISRFEGCNVIITILDRIVDHQNKETKTNDMAMISAARDLSGLWKTHNDDHSVDETVRLMRRGRHSNVYGTSPGDAK